jgi:predicted nucleic acid-binding protein
LLATEQAALTELLGCLELVCLTPASYEIAILLRQQRKLSLGDARIGATCLERGLSLAMCNTGDFGWIDSLKLVKALLH